MQQKNTPRNVLVDRARDFYVATSALRQDRWVGYLAGASLAGLAMLVRILIGDALEGFPFLTYYSAVVITAFVLVRQVLDGGA